MLTRRTVLVAVALLPLLAAGHASAQGQGRPLVFLGDRNLPPYEFLDGATPRGANVELAQAIGRVLGRPVEVRLMDWAQAQARLRAGEGDALTMLGRSEGREANFDFSQPTMPTNFAFFVRSDHEQEFFRRDSLVGWRVAATRGGLARELLATSHPDTAIVLVDDLSQGVDMVRRGTADAVVGDVWALRRVLLDRGIADVVGLPPFARRSGSIAVRDGEAALLAEIDRALGEIKATGEFDAILNRWSHAPVRILPDWVVRGALALGGAGTVALLGLAALSLRLRARTRVLSREIQERNRAVAALAERDKLVAAIGESTPDAVFAKDTDGRVLYVNPAALAILGRPREEVEGHAPREWVNPAVRSPVIDANDRAVMSSGTAQTFTEPGRDASRGGAERIFTVTKAPLRDATGRVAGVVGVARDVTEAQEAADDVANAKQRLEEVMEGAELGGWHWSVTEDHTEYDGRWLSMLGYGQDDLSCRTEGWHALIHPDDAPRVDAALRTHLDGATPRYECEYRLRHRDGSWVWVLDRGRVVERDATGHALVVTGTHLDISARKRVEQALAESRERLALASAAAELGVWDVDVPTGQGIVNGEFRRLYLLPLGTDAPVSHAQFLAAVHPEDRAQVHESAREIHRHGGEYRQEYRVMDQASGEVRWVAVRGQALLADGRVKRTVGVSFDITERKRDQEHQLLLAREVDHRARNVLAVVQSVVRLTRAEDPRDFAAAVEGRVSALARAHTLLSRDRWTGADLEELVREELAAYDPGGATALTGPKLRLDAASVQPLSMVMHELATNAAKYGALSIPGGRVALDWHLEPDGRLLLSWREEQGPPVLVAPVHRGFGTSLIAATVRGQLGGTVTHHWEPAGLRCEITLAPRVLAAPAAVPDPPPPDAPPPPAPLYGRRILLVEDEPLVALALQSVLQDAGCTVRGPVASLAEAQRVGMEEGLDAAVMDVNVLGGVSLPLGARLARRGVPVVYVTGMGLLPGGRTPGAGETVLQKPVGDKALIAALVRAVTVPAI